MIKLDLVNERYGYFICERGMFKDKTMEELRRILQQMEAVVILCNGEEITPYIRARAVRQEAEYEIRSRLKILTNMRHNKGGVL